MSYAIIGFGEIGKAPPKSRARTSCAACQSRRRFARLSKDSGVFRTKDAAGSRPNCQPPWLNTSFASSLMEA